MMTLLLSYKGILAFGAFVLFFILERVNPWFQVKTSIQRLGRNAMLSVINSALSPLIVISSSALISPSQPSSWWFTIVHLLVLDAFLYLWHRLAHSQPWLWRFHQVHHLDQTLDSTSALRFHWGEIALAAIARVGVIALFSIPMITVIFFELLVFIAVVFQHSNWRLPATLEKCLAWIIVTPRVHRQHHHAFQQRDCKNFSTLSTVWDRLFTSFNPSMGEPSDPIGIEHRQDKPIGQLLLLPFKRRQ